MVCWNAQTSHKSPRLLPCGDPDHTDTTFHLCSLKNSASDFVFVTTVGRACPQALAQIHLNDTRRNPR